MCLFFNFDYEEIMRQFFSKKIVKNQLNNIFLFKIMKANGFFNDYNFFNFTSNKYLNIVEI